MADQYNVVTRPTNNLTATADPGAGNDSTQGYVQGSEWHNTTSNRLWKCLSATAGAATWFLAGVIPGGTAPTVAAATGAEPSSMLTQFGSSTATFPEEGNVNRQLSLAGVGNGADATDDVLFTYSLPANAFDVSGRGVCITACGKFAGNGNNKRVKIKFGATLVCDTGVVTTNAGSWMLQANVFKVGAVGANTQLATGAQFITGGVHGGVFANSAPTETESGAITIQVLGSSPTTGAANDVLGQFFEVNAMN